MLQESVGRNLTVLTPGATVAMNCVQGNVFTLTPDQNCSVNAESIQEGQSVDLIVTTSGTDFFIVTLNTGFKTTGTLNTGGTNGKVFVMSFVADGSQLNEKSRTTAM